MKPHPLLLTLFLTVPAAASERLPRGYDPGAAYEPFASFEASAGFDPGARFLPFAAFRADAAYEPLAGFEADLLLVRVADFEEGRHAVFADGAGWFESLPDVAPGHGLALVRDDDPRAPMLTDVLAQRIAAERASARRLAEWHAALARARAAAPEQRAVAARDVVRCRTLAVRAVKVAETLAARERSVRASDLEGAAALPLLLDQVRAELCRVQRALAAAS